LDAFFFEKAPSPTLFYFIGFHLVNWGKSTLFVDDKRCHDN